MNNKLSLLVCSNRINILYQQIWENIIQHKHVSKVILVTQKGSNAYQNNSEKVIHIRLNSKGRSRAVNSGLRVARTLIVGLTDDDCILDFNWAAQATFSLQDASIDLVYGQTKSYQPSRHEGMYCPSTFRKHPNIASVTHMIGKHWMHVGFDNNTAIKKEVFNNIGGYKWWLGPGSLIPAAEDAEFILRAQIAGYRIAYNPRMIVYHNKWLDMKGKEKLMDNYALGGLTAYSYYAFQDVTECRLIMREMVQGYFYEIKNAIKQIIIKRNITLYWIRKLAQHSYFIIKGTCIAYVFAKIIPIPKKENVVKRYYRKKDL